jgi:hypothetical protein
MAINLNIGYIGSSAHGFIYNVENIGFPNKDNPTSAISTTIAGYATMVNNDVKVTPDVYIDALYPREQLLTNNVAEVTAIYLSINKLLMVYIFVYINVKRLYSSLVL